MDLCNENALTWRQLHQSDDKDLSEFAISTLRCSPTSMAVDRSFSIQKVV